MSKDEALIKGTIDTVLRYTYPDEYKRYLSELLYPHQAERIEK
ncbi:hypothetical protein [Enterococcus faecium]|nr:hypothetical protein [Enterococcus faecium]